MERRIIVTLDMDFADGITSKDLRNTVMESIEKDGVRTFPGKLEDEILISGEWDAVMDAFHAEERLLAKFSDVEG